MRHAIGLSFAVLFARHVYAVDGPRYHALGNGDVCRK